MLTPWTVVHKTTLADVNLKFTVRASTLNLAYVNTLDKRHTVFFFFERFFFFLKLFTIQKPII